MRVGAHTICWALLFGGGAYLLGEQIERVAGPVVAGGYRGFDPSACTYGSAEQVTEQLGAYAAMGYTDVIVRHLAEDQGEVLASFARLAGVREALLAA